ncbi:hypothetical protein ACFFUT_09855 [Pseudohalocynthiibacter aestuariivivens]|jgi:predicted branched-subunit amino acid permease|uniref:Uncharacterized protein n=1 Tax=Pseudohalocynthiibacter aestuariivivens TaxID=1591409 RepID=A0ABV5JG60_9RHOB|nr:MULTISPECIES: hypothetical protein [Pseudohalocynthiibacter]MBS9717875.1 hypothetical protein [Pseudohalocynthiibacter aestuariivivens]MCK0102976.1 hypothetical protein [Pseudohalocynthiibacter sp. F2068]
MPKLVRLYIIHVLIGFLLSAVFVALLLVSNVGNLWHLISTSSMGLVAVVMLFVFNGIVFAGVQFGWAIMRMSSDDTPSGGTRMRIKRPIGGPIRVQAEVKSKPW